MNNGFSKKQIRHLKTGITEQVNPPPAKAGLIGQQADWKLSTIDHLPIC